MPVTASVGNFDVEPMTLSLMGKLFGVPLLIIGTIVGGAVLVVVLFGGPAAPQQRSIDSILQTLEAGSGEKSLGVLLPREKELWQMALELAKRLEKKESELTLEEIQAVAGRIGAMVVADLDRVDYLATTGSERATQQDVRSRRLEFLIHALGRTGSEDAVEPLVRVVETGREPFASAAMRQLGEMKGVANISQAVVPIVKLLTGSNRPETRMVACTALAALDVRGNEVALAALRTALRTGENEVSWSAAIALAYLGDASATSVLLDLLDRSFWETGERYEVRDDAGNVRRYRMPPQRVNDLLIAAIDASAKLNEPDLWAAIERLKSDPFPAVRAAAMKALNRRAGVPAGGGAAREKE